MLCDENSCDVVTRHQLHPHHVHCAISLRCLSPTWESNVSRAWFHRKVTMHWKERNITQHSFSFHSTPSFNPLLCPDFLYSLIRFSCVIVVGIPLRELFHVWTVSRRVNVITASLQLQLSHMWRGDFDLEPLAITLIISHIFIFFVRVFGEQRILMQNLVYYVAPRTFATSLC